MAFSETEIVAKSNKFHVSNVQLYEYLDEARSEWYRYCISIGVESVLVHSSIDFKKEIFNNDKLLIRTWLERVGNTSFTLKQAVVNQGDAQVAFADIVLATIDRQARTKVKVPQEVRKLLDDPANLNEIICDRVKTF
jgi:acyl-CoA thioesterase FadM